MYLHPQLPTWVSALRMPEKRTFQMGQRCYAPLPQHVGCDKAPLKLFSVSTTLHWYSRCAAT